MLRSPLRAIRQILEHSESKAVFIGKLDHYDAYNEAIPPGVIKVGISAYGISEENTWEDWLKSEPYSGCYLWKPQEILTIIYTSGTTGKSKGVMHAVESFYQVGISSGTRIRNSSTSQAILISSS